MGSTTHTPKDAKVMASILKDCGINEYEPRVINQMLEFAYRYVSDLLEDSKVYSDYANKKQIDIEDVKLAIQMKVDNTFTSPPPKELLLEIAKEKNTQPLPALKQQSGLRLPPDRYCLTQPNYRLKAGVHHTLINTTDSKPVVRYPIKKEPPSTTTPLLPPIKAQPPLHPVQSAPTLIQPSQPPRAAAPAPSQTFIISATTSAEATSTPSSQTVSVPPPITAAGPSKSLFRLVSGASDSTAGSSNAASTSVSVKRKVEPLDEGLPTAAKKKYDLLDEDYDNLNL